MKIDKNKLDENKLEKIRICIIDKIIENDFIMYDGKIRNYLSNDNCLDLVEVIVDLYEYLHQIITGEEYDYMFHWANKIGSWVETGKFDEEVERYINEFKKPIEPIPYEEEKIVHCIDCKHIDIVGNTAYCSNPYGLQNQKLTCNDYCSRGEE